MAKKRVKKIPVIMDLTGKPVSVSTVGVDELRINTKAPGYRLVRERMVDFNHAKAQAYIDLPAVPGERELRPTHVDELVRWAKTGRLLIDRVNVAVCFCKEDGNRYKTDGQHTAHMRLKMPADWAFRIHYQEYEADTLDDVRQLYAMFDRNAARHNAHIVASRMLNTKEYAGFSSGTLRQTVAGYQMYRVPPTMKKGGLVDYSIDELMYEKVELGTTVASIVDSLNRSGGGAPLYRAPVIAAMFATAAVDKAAAKKFWDKVQTPLGMSSANHPIFQLHRWLGKHTLSVGRNARAVGVEKTDQESMYRVCILCWNHYRDGNPAMKQIRVPTERPKAL